MVKLNALIPLQLSQRYTETIITSYFSFQLLQYNSYSVYFVGLLQLALCPRHNRSIRKQDMESNPLEDQYRVSA